MNICGAILPDNISPYLKVYITDVANADFVVGYIGDGAAASLSAEWSAPFAGFNLGSVAGQTAGGALGKVGDLVGKGAPKVGAALGALGGLAEKAGEYANDAASLFFGTAMGAVLNSAMVWQGQQPPQFSMPIYFLAHSDPYREVQQAIVTLQKMASPQLNAVMPGGRIPGKVTVDIGRRIKLTNVIIQEVTYELDAPRNSQGYFIQNNVTLQLIGSSAYNADQLDSVFV